MRYTTTDFIRLLSEIEAQGGEHLDEPCEAKEYPYTKGGEDKLYHAKGCAEDGSHETMFNVAYDPTATVLVPQPILEPDPARDGRSKRSKKDENGNAMVEFVEYPGDDIGPLADKHTVRVCAGHDNVGAWPRFAGVIEDGAR